MPSYEEIELKSRECLWEDVIPIRELTVVAGHSGIAKGYWMADVIARVTRGDAMPDGSAGPEAGNVITVTTEDEPSYEMGWRLKAAKAHPGRVHDFTFPDGHEFTLGGRDSDLERLRRYVYEVQEEYGPVRMIYIDPLSDVSGVSLTAVQTVRRQIVRPLRQLARDLNVAIVLMHHLTKAGQVAGSAAIVAAARSVLMIGLDDDPRLRTVSIYKSNIAETGRQVCAYRLVGERPETAVAYLWRPETGERGKRIGPGQLAALRALRAVQHPLHYSEIAEEIGVSEETCRVILFKLKRRGLAYTPVERGYWAAVPQDEVEQVQVSA